MVEEEEPNKKKGGRVLLIIGSIVVVIVLAVILLMVTGALKFNFKDSRTGQQSTPSTTDKVKSVSEPKSYQSEDYGFSLQYPGDWSLKENPGGQFKMAFQSAPESSTDEYREFVGIGVVDLTANPSMSLQEAADLWEQQTASASQDVNFQVIDREQSILAGNEAKDVVFTATFEGIPVKGFTRITLADSKAYIFTYFAETDKYDTFLSQAESILSSVTFQS